MNEYGWIWRTLRRALTSEEASNLVDARIGKVIKNDDIASLQILLREEAVRQREALAVAMDGGRSTDDAVAMKTVCASQAERLPC